jgi:hypothetical protein
MKINQDLCYTEETPTTQRDVQEFLCMPSNPILSLLMRSTDGTVVGESLVERTPQSIITQLSHLPPKFILEVKNVALETQDPKRAILVLVMKQQIVGCYALDSKLAIQVSGHRQPNAFVPFEAVPGEDFKLSAQIWTCRVTSTSPGHCCWPVNTSRLVAVEYAHDLSQCRTLELERLSNEPLFVFVMTCSPRQRCLPVLGQETITRSMKLLNYVPDTVGRYEEYQRQSRTRLQRSISVPALRHAIVSKKRSIDLSSFRRLHLK